MRDFKAIPGKDILLGKRGENLHLRVVFDISGWRKVYGDGEAVLLHRRSGDKAPYPCVVEQDGDKAYWTVTDTDVEMAGNGKAELQYIVGETCVKSDVYTTFAEQGLDKAGKDPGRPEASWVAEVLRAKGKAEDARRDIENMTVTGAFVPVDSGEPAVEKSKNDDGTVNLHFSFPATEGMGDMMSDTYDPSGIAQDVYQYADEAAAAVQQDLAEKDPFVITYGGDDVVSYKKVDLKLFQDVVDAYTAGRPIILHRWVNGKLHQSSLSMTDYTDSADVLIFREPMESGYYTNCRFIRYPEDGYVKWTRESKYPTPAEHTHDPASIGAAVTKVGTATVSTGWSKNTTYGYYYKTVSIGSVLTTDTPIVDLTLSATDMAANKLQLEAWAKVGRIVAGSGQLTLYAYGDAPAVAFKIQAKVVR